MLRAEGFKLHAAAASPRPPRSPPSPPTPRFTLLACNDHQRMSLFRKWRSILQPVDPTNFPPPGHVTACVRSLHYHTILEFNTLFLMNETNELF